MLKKLGQIFKSTLPNNSDRVIRANYELANYTRYEKNANVFRSFIEIDTVKAQELNLSYFKTVTINKFQNSKYSNEKLGYVNFLDENQRLNIQSFISNNDLNRDYNLIKSEILGRDLNLNDLDNKLSIEHFSSRKSYNYNVGLTVATDFQISQYQDLFFELSFATIAYNFPNATAQYQFLQNITKYDLIIYAMDNKNQIIDVKKIENFNTAGINWVVDRSTSLFNIDDVDFNKLFNITFSTSVYNNLQRQFFINLTDTCKTYRESSEIGFIPIESFSIQENSLPIETQLNNIQTETVFANNVDKIRLDCRTPLLNRAVPFEITYTMFMKIAGTNSYIIKKYQNTITDARLLQLVPQQDNLNRFIGNTKIKYLSNSNTIKIDLKMLNSAFENENFNPVLSGIYINNELQNNFVDRCFNAIPRFNDLENLNLNGTNLKTLFNNSNDNESSFIFYLRGYAPRFNILTLEFTQDFITYVLNFPIEYVYELVSYDQSLTIQNNLNFNTRDFSNLDITYKLLIKNFKNSNTNLNRFLSLNYENIFLQELQESKTQLDANFENNIFVIVKKSIYQDNEFIKDKFYIFNKDIFQNIQTSFQTDLSLELKFNDNLLVNSFFFKSFSYDNLNLNKDVKYKFEAKVMIIPLGFFITTSEWSTRERIKELLSLNKPLNSLPSAGIIDSFYGMLKNINDNKFSDLNQLILYKLYSDFCLNNTVATNEIFIKTRNNSQVLNNIFSYRNIGYTLNKGRNQSKILKFVINFDIIDTVSNSNILLSLMNDLQNNIFKDVYFRDNNQYTNSAVIIPQFTNIELENEFKNNISIKYELNSNTLQINVDLRLSPELIRFFNFAYNRSTNTFLPYNFDFLNQNLYFKLNLPDSISRKIDQTHTISFNNIQNKYIMIDFYQFIEN